MQTSRYKLTKELYLEPGTYVASFDIATILKTVQ